MVTHGPDNPEKATIPFVFANSAIAAGLEVKVGIQAMGAYLVKKGGADNVVAPGFTPLKDLIESYLEAGGEILVCGPCVNSRNIKQEDLIEGTKNSKCPYIHK